MMVATKALSWVRMLAYNLIRVKAFWASLESARRGFVIAFVCRFISFPFVPAAGLLPGLPALNLHS